MVQAVLSLKYSLNCLTLPRRIPSKLEGSKASMFEAGLSPEIASPWSARL